MSEIKRDIAAFDALKPELEKTAEGQWVLIRESKLISTYDTFNEAAQDAVSQFGRGPYLIRQVGMDNFTLPASVMYNFHA